MTQLTFQQFIDNLKSRGYKDEALLEFITSVPSERVTGARPLWEWNVMLDAYLTARNYDGPEKRN